MLVFSFSMTKKVKGDNAFSSFILSHYSAISWIYIIWNVILARADETDEQSRRFFFLFSIAEIPVAIGTLVVFLGLQWPGMYVIKNFGINNYAEPIIIIISL